MKLYHIALLSMLAMASHAQQRTTVDIRSWQFSRDSVEWQSVRIPHDWAIAGPFDKKWDLQNVAIEQNGEKQKTEKSGRSGALPWIGEGFYRTTVSVDKVPEHALL
ncbi:MAG: beta-galactosidase, partial [Prevotella sp.]|nr:beta-galactosidase [Prevotella sp.]